MWESVSAVLTSSNATIVLMSLIIIICLIAIFSKKGLFKIRTQHLQIGYSERERSIIRQQIEWSHLYIMSLRSKIEYDESEYNGYFTKYILERCYDKVVEWITFNHINTKNSYIEIKQEEICSLVYGLGVKDEFKTPEFKERMFKWTREIIEHLCKIRDIYGD